MDMGKENDLYRIVFATAQDPLLLIDGEEIVDANEQAQAFFGCRSEALIGRQLSSFSPLNQPDGNHSATLLQKRMERARKQACQQFAWSFQLPQRGLVTGQICLKQLRVSDRSLFTVTLGEQQSQPSQEDKERFRAVLNNVQDGYFEVDLTGNFTFINAAICQMFGYIEEELLAMNYRDYLDEVNARKVFATFHQVFRTGEPISNFEYEIQVARDQSTRAIQSSVALILSAGGQPVGFRGIIRDITEQRAATEALQRAHDQLEQRVQERTVELTQANEALQIQIQERIQAERELDQLVEHRGRQVQLSTQIAQDIAAATNLDDLYLRVVTQIKEQFNYYHTQLLRYDPALDTVALVVGYGEVGEKMVAVHHSIPMGVGIIGTVAKTGQSLLQTDVSKDATWQSNPLLPQTRGELAVPIKLGDEVLGVLDVQSNIANALGREDQLLLEGLCGQIAVAIDSTRLRQSMEAQLRELNSLQRYMSREGWEDYRASRPKIIGYQFGHAGVEPLRPETGPLHTWYLPADLHTSEDGDTSPSPAINIDPSGTISTPLIVRGQSIGTLGIIDDPEEPLSAEELELFSSISEQVAEALEVARLFEQTQESLAEQQRLASELETVAQVSTAASTLLDVDTLLQSVVDLAKESFGLYHAHIYLVDDESEELVLRAGAGSIGRLMALEGRTVDINSDTLIAQAAREHQAILQNDVRKTLLYLPHRLLPNTQAELVVPMVVGDTVLGIMNLQSDRTNYFTAEDLKTHKVLATQIAIAVQNSLRYAEQVKTASKLRQVDQLKSEFLASMSHELRTPLNSIIGFADVLLEGLDGDLNERMEEDVRLIRDSGDHLRSLIGDILDMSKIEAGRMELRYEELDMRQIASDVISTANPLAHDKSLALYADIAPEVGLVEADRTRLRQILWNIVGNAIKFTEEGAVILSMQLHQDNLLVSVRDTGIGIEPEDIPIVFEQFRQVDGSLNRSVGGTGLGMPITKNLIELHGGEIWIESVVGQGSTFWFTIPLKRPAPRRSTSPLPSVTEANPV